MLCALQTCCKYLEILNMYIRKIHTSTVEVDGTESG